jgi:hypothetical protein
MIMAMIPFVICGKCSQPTLLPLPTLDETPIHRQCRTKNDWQIKLACPECGYAYVYLEQDIRWRPLDRNVLDIYRDTAFLRIESECEEGCSGFRIVWHTRTAISTNGAQSGTAETKLEPTLDIVEKIEGRFYQALSCKQGHPYSSTVVLSRYRIEKGLDWWSA